MVTDIAESCGIGGKESENLDRVLADILDNIVKFGFEGERRKPIDVVISRRLHALVIAIEDKGLPFDYEKLERGEEKRFSSYLSRQYADEVHFATLGAGGTGRRS